MTLVLTAASQHGITVIADRRFSRTYTLPSGQQITEPHSVREKVFFNGTTLIAFAIWGKDGKVASDTHPEKNTKSLRKVVNAFCQKLGEEQSVHDTAKGLAEKLNSLYVAPGHGLDRRGVHVSGFQNGAPVVYHVHSGHPRIGATEEFNVTCDSETFKDALQRGECCVIAGGISDFYLGEKQDMGLPLPFRSNSLELQEAVLRNQFVQIYEDVSGHNLKYASTVGDSVDVVSFNHLGFVQRKHELWAKLLASVPHTELKGRAVVGTTLAISLASVPISLMRARYKSPKKK